jgi:hypothetical protein
MLHARWRSRSTIRDWSHGRVPAAAGEGDCEDHVALLEAGAYAYLLGMYLGDGCISEHPRGVQRLRITLDASTHTRANSSAASSTATAARIIATERKGRAVPRAPRYAFSNRSEDILQLFAATCTACGIHYTRASVKQIAIYSKHAVARLDEFVGPKT